MAAEGGDGGDDGGAVPDRRAVHGDRARLDAGVAGFRLCHACGVPCDAGVLFAWAGDMRVACAFRADAGAHQGERHGDCAVREPVCRVGAGVVVLPDGERMGLRAGVLRLCGIRGALLPHGAVHPRDEGPFARRHRAPLRPQASRIARVCRAVVSAAKNAENAKGIRFADGCRAIGDGRSVKRFAKVLKLSEKVLKIFEKVLKLRAKVVQEFFYLRVRFP